MPPAAAAASAAPRWVCNNLWQTRARYHVDLPHETKPLCVHTPLLDPTAVSDGQVLFVKTDLLDLFVAAALPHVRAKGIVLITGHSDLSPSAYATAVIHAASKRNVIKKWYAVNLQLATRVARPLPLGLAEPDRPHGDQAAVAAAAACQQNTKLPSVLVTPHSPSHPVRRIVDAFDHPRLVRTQCSDSYESYLNTLARYSYVLCPRGNGIDVHRVYEAILMGTVPIYVSEDTPPAIYASLPVVVCCAPEALYRTLSCLPDTPPFTAAQWAASRGACLAAGYRFF